MYLPGSSANSLRQITSILKECGAKVCQFFHKKICYLITSDDSIELEKREKLTSKKLLGDPSSRGAMFLARATKDRNKVSIFERAKRLGVNVVRLKEIDFSLWRKKELSDCSYSKEASTKDRVQRAHKVRRLRSPFIKVVDPTECYRPLVLEMKEWPDAFTMFSKGPNVLPEMEGRKRRTTFCELCNVHFDDFQKHLSGSTHTKNATNNKIWERVDAIRAKLPTMEEIIESKIKQLQQF